MVSDKGQRIGVLKVGMWNGSRFEGAKIVVDGAEYNGDVAIGAVDDHFRLPILQVVDAAEVPHFLKDDDAFVPQITVKISPVMRVGWDILQQGRDKAGCAKHIKAMQEHERVGFLSRLQVERLARKCGELEEIFRASDENWNETAYIMLARGFGGANNKAPFEELAKRVRYGYISRERGDMAQVEALLLGTSGLLETRQDDKYTRLLREHFEHLRHKYSLEAMAPGMWKTININPQGHPVLRIVQMAKFLVDRTTFFDDMIGCRTAESVQKLFRTEVSDYWTTDANSKGVGHFTANVLGINIVTTLMFGYGKWLGDEKLKGAAMDLLDRLGCDDNRLVNPWRAGGVVMENAFESQAILQLNNEYCLKGRCADCMVGQRVMREVYMNEII